MSQPMTAETLARARRALMRRDPRLGAVIRQVGACGLAESRTRDPFTSLVRAILSQQLSVKAADTIYGRVARLAGSTDGIPPGAMLALDVEALRGAGVSRPKASYLRDLAARVDGGRLDLHALDARSDEEVIAALTAVKGLGRWSAEMFLIFRLNRPDILPVGDVGIIRGMQQLFGMKRRPKPRTMVRLAEPWRPYRSVASWYLWAGAEFL